MRGLFREAGLNRENVVAVESFTGHSTPLFLLLLLLLLLLCQDQVFTRTCKQRYHMVCNPLLLNQHLAAAAAAASTASVSSPSF